jgi:hypothetical protein
VFYLINDLNASTTTPTCFSSTNVGTGVGPTWDNTNKWLVLSTSSENGTQRSCNFTSIPGNNFVTEFDTYAGVGPGGQHNYFTFGDNAFYNASTTQAYGVTFSESGIVGAPANKINLYTLGSSSSNSVIASSATLPFVFDDGVWRTAKITVNGANVSVKINGTEYLNYTIPSYAPAGTNIGYYTYNNTTGSRNDHRIRNLTFESVATLSVSGSFITTGTQPPFNPNLADNNSYPFGVYGNTTSTSTSTGYTYTTNVPLATPAKELIAPTDATNDVGYVFTGWTGCTTTFNRYTSNFSGLATGITETDTSLNETCVLGFTDGAPHEVVANYTKTTLKVVTATLASGNSDYNDIDNVVITGTLGGTTTLNTGNAGWFYTLNGTKQTGFVRAPNVATNDPQYGLNGWYGCGPNNNNTVFPHVEDNLNAAGSSGTDGIFETCYVDYQDSTDHTVIAQYSKGVSQIQVYSSTNTASAGDYTTIDNVKILGRDYLDTETYNGTDTYTRQFTVRNDSGAAQTNYQAELVLNTQSLIASGKLNSTCDQIRVFEVDGTTPIPFIVVNCNTTSTSIWVKYATLPIGQSIAKVTYGTNALSNISNPAALDIYDLSSTTTTPLYTLQGSASWNNSLKELIVATGGSNNSSYSLGAQTNNNFVYDYEFSQFNPSFNPKLCFGFGADTITASSGPTNGYELCNTAPSSITLQKVTVSGRSAATGTNNLSTSNTTPFNDTTYHKMRITFNGSRIVQFIDGRRVFDFTITTYAPNGSFVGFTGNNDIGPNIQKIKKLTSAKFNYSILSFLGAQSGTVTDPNTATTLGTYGGTTADFVAAQGYRYTKNSPLNQPITTELYAPLTATNDPFYTFSSWTGCDATIDQYNASWALGTDGKAETCVVTNYSNTATPKVVRAQYISTTGNIKVTTTTPNVTDTDYNNINAVKIVSDDAFIFDSTNTATISVNNTTGTSATNQTIALDLNTLSYVASGSLRSDCGNIRVYLADGVTLVPYATEFCNSTNTSVFFQPTSLATGITQFKIKFLATTTTASESPATVYSIYDLNSVTTTPTCALNSNIQWDNTNKVLTQTTATVATFGQCNYTLNQNNSYRAFFDFKAGTANGSGHAIVYDYNSGTRPTTFLNTTNAANGSLLDLSDNANQFVWRANGGTNVISAVNTDNVFERFGYNRTGNNSLKVVKNGTTLNTFTSTPTQTLTNTQFGILLENLTTYNQYQVRNLNIANLKTGITTSLISTPFNVSNAGISTNSYGSYGSTTATPSGSGSGWFYNKTFTPITGQQTRLFPDLSATNDPGYAFFEWQGCDSLENNYDAGYTAYPANTAAVLKDGISETCVLNLDTASNKSPRAVYKSSNTQINVVANTPSITDPNYLLLSDTKILSADRYTTPPTILRDPNSFQDTTPATTASYGFGTWGGKTNVTGGTGKYYNKNSASVGTGGLINTQLIAPKELTTLSTDPLFGYVFAGWDASQCTAVYDNYDNAWVVQPFLGVTNVNNELNETCFVNFSDGQIHNVYAKYKRTQITVITSTTNAVDTDYLKVANINILQTNAITATANPNDVAYNSTNLGTLGGITNQSPTVANTGYYYEKKSSGILAGGLIAPQTPKVLATLTSTPSDLSKFQFAGWEGCDTYTNAYDTAWTANGPTTVSIGQGTNHETCNFSFNDGANHILRAKYTPTAKLTVTSTGSSVTFAKVVSQDAFTANGGPFEPGLAGTLTYTFGNFGAQTAYTKEQGTPIVTTLLPEHETSANKVFTNWTGCGLSNNNLASPHVEDLYTVHPTTGVWTAGTDGIFESCVVNVALGVTLSPVANYRAATTLSVNVTRPLTAGTNPKVVSDDAFTTPFDPALATVTAGPNYQGIYGGTTNYTKTDGSIVTKLYPQLLLSTGEVFKRWTGCDSYQDNYNAGWTGAGTLASVTTGQSDIHETCVVDRRNGTSNTVVAEYQVTSLQVYSSKTTSTDPYYTQPNNVQLFDQAYYYANYLGSDPRAVVTANYGSLGGKTTTSGGTSGYFYSKTASTIQGSLVAPLIAVTASQGNQDFKEWLGCSSTTLDLYNSLWQRTTVTDTTSSATPVGTATPDGILETCPVSFADYTSHTVRAVYGKSKLQVIAQTLFPADPAYATLNNNKFLDIGDAAVVFPVVPTIQDPNTITGSLGTYGGNTGTYSATGYYYNGPDAFRIKSRLVAPYIATSPNTDYIFDSWSGCTTTLDLYDETAGYTIGAGGKFETCEMDYNNGLTNQPTARYKSLYTQLKVNTRSTSTSDALDFQINDVKILSDDVYSVSSIRDPNLFAGDILGNPDGFGFRARGIALTNTTAGVLTNSIATLVWDTQTLIAGGAMRSDCGDLRVKTLANVALVYDVISCNSTTTVVKAIIPTLPVGTTQFKLTYSDPALTGNTNPGAFVAITYTRPITINNTSGGVITNAISNTTLDTTALINSGKMRSDCADVRVQDVIFTPYTFEVVNCNTTNTIVRVLVPSLPIGLTTLNLTYGDLNLSSAGNHAAFTYYEDLLSSTTTPLCDRFTPDLVVPEWNNTTKTLNMAYYHSGPILYPLGYCGTTYTGSDIDLSYEFKSTQFNKMYVGWGTDRTSILDNPQQNLTCTPSDGGGNMVTFYDQSPNRVRIKNAANCYDMYLNTTGSALNSTTPDLSTGGWKTIRITSVNGNINVYEDGQLIVSLTAPTTTYGNRFFINVENDLGDISSVIRNLVLSKPNTDLVASALGTETASQAVIPGVIGVDLNPSFLGNLGGTTSFFTSLAPYSYTKKSTASGSLVGRLVAPGRATNDTSHYFNTWVGCTTPALDLWNYNRTTNVWSRNSTVDPAGIVDAPTSSTPDGYFETCPINLSNSALNEVTAKYEYIAPPSTLQVFSQTISSLDSGYNGIQGIKIVSRDSFITNGPFNPATAVLTPTSTFGTNGGTTSTLQSGDGWYYQFTQKPISNSLFAPLIDPTGNFLFRGWTSCSSTQDLYNGTWQRTNTVDSKGFLPVGTATPDGISETCHVSFDDGFIHPVTARYNATRVRVTSTTLSPSDVLVNAIDSVRFVSSDAFGPTGFNAPFDPNCAGTTTCGPGPYPFGTYGGTSNIAGNPYYYEVSTSAISTKFIAPVLATNDQTYSFIDWSGCGLGNTYDFYNSLMQRTTTVDPTGELATGTATPDGKSETCIVYRAAQSFIQPRARYSETKLRVSTSAQSAIDPLYYSIYNVSFASTGGGYTGGNPNTATNLGPFGQTITNSNPNGGAASFNPSYQIGRNYTTYSSSINSVIIAGLQATNTVSPTDDYTFIEWQGCTGNTYDLYDQLWARTTVVSPVGGAVGVAVPDGVSESCYVNQNDGFLHDISAVYAPNTSVIRLNVYAGYIDTLDNSHVNGIDGVRIADIGPVSSYSSIPNPNTQSGVALGQYGGDTGLSGYQHIVYNTNIQTKLIAPVNAPNDPEYRLIGWNLGQFGYNNNCNIASNNYDSTYNPVASTLTPTPETVNIVNETCELNLTTAGNYYVMAVYKRVKIRVETATKVAADPEYSLISNVPILDILGREPGSGSPLASYDPLAASNVGNLGLYGGISSIIVNNVNTYTKASPYAQIDAKLVAPFYRSNTLGELQRFVRWDNCSSAGRSTSDNFTSTFSVGTDGLAETCTISYNGNYIDSVRAIYSDRVTRVRVFSSSWNSFSTINSYGVANIYDLGLSPFPIVYPNPNAIAQGSPLLGTFGGTTIAHSGPTTLYYYDIAVSGVGLVDGVVNTRLLADHLNFTYPLSELHQWFGCATSYDYYNPYNLYQTSFNASEICEINFANGQQNTIAAAYDSTQLYVSASTANVNDPDYNDLSGVKILEDSSFGNPTNTIKDPELATNLGLMGGTTQTTGTCAYNLGKCYIRYHSRINTKLIATLYPSTHPNYGFQNWTGCNLYEDNYKSDYTPGQDGKFETCVMSQDFSFRTPRAIYNDARSTLNVNSNYPVAITSPDPSFNATTNFSVFKANINTTLVAPLQLQAGNTVIQFLNWNNTQCTSVIDTNFDGKAETCQITVPDGVTRTVTANYGIYSILYGAPITDQPNITVNATSATITSATVTENGSPIPLGTACQNTLKYLPSGTLKTYNSTFNALGQCVTIIPSADITVTGEVQLQTLFTARTVAFQSPTSNRFVVEGIYNNSLYLYFDADHPNSFNNLGQINDLSGRGSFGTTTTYNSTGIKSWQFNGTSNYIYSTLPSNYSTDVTLEIWYKRTGTNRGALISQERASGVTSTPFALTNDTDKLGARVSDTDYRQGDFTSNTFWQQGVVTYDTGTNKISIYANGVKQNEYTYLMNSPTSAGLEIGRSFGTDYFSGQIAVVRAYSGALPSTTIRQNFETQKARFGFTEASINILNQPATVNFGTYTYSPSTINATASFPNLGFLDRRSNSSGWTASIATSNFVNTITSLVVPASTLSLSRNVLPRDMGSPLYTSYGSAGGFSGAGVNKTLFDVSQFNGTGRYYSNENFNIAIPPNTPNGIYNGTITISVVNN